MVEMKSLTEVYTLAESLLNNININIYIYNILSSLYQCREERRKNVFRHWKRKTSLYPVATRKTFGN